MQEKIKISPYIREDYYYTLKYYAEKWDVSLGKVIEHLVNDRFSNSLKEIKENPRKYGKPIKPRLRSKR